MFPQYEYVTKPKGTHTDANVSCYSVDLSFVLVFLYEHDLERFEFLNLKLWTMAATIYTTKV